MNWKNRLILAGTSLWRKTAATDPPRRGFLVVSTTALGDSLWAAPALESLRKSFPDARIALLTSPIGEQALRHNPWVDRTYVLIEPLLPRFFSLLKALRQEQIDTVLDFHSSQRMILPLCSCIGARKIVGTEGINKGLDELLNISLRNRDKHEIVRRLEMVEAVGGKRWTESLSYFLTAEEKEKSPQLSKGPYVALHPGSKDGFKRWPAEHFGQIGRRLQQMGYRILLTGTAEERHLLEYIQAHIPGSEISDLHLPLRSFAALLSQVELLISNDTGPVHLACALNVPVLALYSATDPQLCGPRHALKAQVISRPPTCDSCLKRACRRPFCLMQIGPDEVLEKARAILASCR